VSGGYFDVKQRSGISKHMFSLPYPVAILGSAIVLLLAFLTHWIGHRVITKRRDEPRERYRQRKFLNTAIIVLAVMLIGLLWARRLQRTSTFLGLVGAGVAIALRDPLLSVAGRIAIFAGHMYTVGDRIEINQLKGDVIDVGFFYTRMMEIGSWIKADQFSGRIVQFSNSMIFGSAVFNYTQNFSYIWDEVVLPITYDSDLQAAKNILLTAGRDYSRDFLKDAQSDLKAMQRYFVVPQFELEPTVFVKVTDNWLELSMRYVVNPKQRRAGASFIYENVFKQLREREDVKIASTTMDLTVHREDQSAA
jgi:small-conductance mechanosensitive channel